ncbi:DsbA family protein [Sneathiella marina]|uniref:DsbA family protein n=1 Tax=Sneathiella marina TaxID=2950108 RepID=A0ABY4VXY7_9PROT|nr:DsbA family protein [Sneathiella marina]USG59489.1 DsbA family protein [Sneathiella marina]
MAGNSKLSVLSIGSIIALVGLIGFGIYQYGLKATSTPVADKEFGEKVRGYLMANPYVLRDVIEELKAQEQLAASQQQSATLASLSDELKNDPSSFVAGNPDGDVTIVEFFDYRCGYCKRNFPDLMKTVEDDGNIRLVLKEFPILGEDSVLASQAAIASISQGKYMEFHTALMAVRGGLTKDRILNIASDVGLDVQKLEEDMQGEAVQNIIRKNYSLAQQLGVNGTPAFVIEDTFYPGAATAEQMEKLIVAAREKKKTTATN